MAATVRAVFETGPEEGFGPTQGRSFEKNAKQATIGRIFRPGAEEAREGFGRTRATARGDRTAIRSRNRRADGKDPRIRTNLPTEPDAGASAGDRARGHMIARSGPMATTLGAKYLFTRSTRR